jgi:hypothetical protein
VRHPSTLLCKPCGSRMPYGGQTLTLSCKRSAHYAAHLFERTSNWMGGNRNASAASRACRLQRHVTCQAQMT